MTKHQIIIVSTAILLTGVLYFAVDTKLKKTDKQESIIKEDGELSNFDQVINIQKDSISAESKKEIEFVEKSLLNTSTDSMKLELLKKLASLWYKEGKAVVSAYYAEKIAEKENTAEAWQIAGTTYRLGIQNTNNEKLKDLSSQRAVKTLETAIKLDSAKITYKIQLAMVYVDRPLQNNPMKGILMLRDLNEKYPDQPGVILQLGQLAMRTGQYEKAIERFKKALTLLPKESNIYCLLADAYTAKGDNVASFEAAKKCKK
ncbi:MAG TPA: tetratricopeptide repeat protein [Saprospiraceae bacterium]|nr:tetratricopeptide repeat protein [Saprospiraceae bacterium]